MTNKTILYSSGNIAGALPFSAFNTFIFFFYVDILKVPAALIGTGMAIYGIWNAVNDPLFGYISDRTNTRWGKRIPYIKFGAIPFVVAFFLLWIPPVKLLNNNVTLLFIYFMIFIFLYDGLYTLIFLNFASLFPAMFRTEEERVKAATYKWWFAIPSAMIGTALTPVLYGFLGWAWMAFIYSFISLVFLQVSLKGSYEDTAAITENTMSVFAAFKATINNKAFLLYVSANIMIQLTINLLQAGMPFYAKYVLKVNDVKTSLLLGIIFISAMFFIKLWGDRAKNIGNRKTFMQSIVILGITLIPLYFVNSFAMALATMAFVGIGISGINILLDLLLASIIDADETVTGLRREGMYYGTNALFMRLSITLQSVIMALSLKLSGYDANLSVNSQPASALVGIRFIVAIVPIIATIAAVVFISFYPEKSKAVL